MIFYVYVKCISAVQNVAKGDFLKFRYRVNIVVFGFKSTYMYNVQACC